MVGISASHWLNYTVSQKTSLTFSTVTWKQIITFR